MRLLLCGAVADLFWLLQSPMRVRGSVHACTGVCACSCMGCHAHMWVQPSTHTLYAQPHGCTHSCAPTHPWLTPAMYAHSAPAVPHFAPPCTLPVFRLPWLLQLPSPQLSKVPWAGTWLCPARTAGPQSTGGSGLPTFPFLCTQVWGHLIPSDAFCGATAATSPTKSQGPLVWHSQRSGSTCQLALVFYGPAQCLLINAKPSFICFWSYKGELTKLCRCNRSLLLPGAGWRGQQDTVPIPHCAGKSLRELGLLFSRTFCGR